MLTVSLLTILITLYISCMNASFTQPTDVVPYYSLHGQGSHSRLGSNKYQAGLLYQDSPIHVKLTGETVILRQHVNFDILNEKMSTLNTFQETITAKIKALHNSSLDSLNPLNPKYVLQPQIFQLRAQLNKTLHNSRSNLMFKHSSYCLKQQEIMQKILQTQEYEHCLLYTSTSPRDS